MSQKGACANYYSATLAVDVNAAKKQLDGATSQAALDLSGAVAFLVSWVVLQTARYRFSSRRRTQLIVETIGLFLTTTAFMCAVFAVNKTSDELRLPFTIPVDDVLRKGLNRWDKRVIRRVPGQWKDDASCPRVLSLNQTQLEDIRHKASFLALAHRKRPVLYLSIGMGTIALLLCLACIFSAFRVAFGKQNTRPNKVKRISPRTSQSRPSNPRNKEFSGLIEKVEYPPNNDNASSRCIICARTMWEDVVRLRACKDSFHRKCILHWLSLAKELKCPICDVSLQAKVDSDNEEVSFSSVRRLNLQMTTNKVEDKSVL